MGGRVLFNFKNNLGYYTFPNFDPLSGLRHGVFTRKPGFSSPPFDELNIGLNVGDNVADVQENRRAIMDCMPGMQPFYIKQVHGATVVTIDERCLKNGGLHGPPMEADAMVTGLTGIMPVIQVADCQPVFICDPIRKVVANIHAGWRGSISNIIAATVDRMRSDFGSRPADMMAGVGPSLGPCCAEFKNYRTEIPEPFWKYRIGRHHFDFWAISRDQLTRSGVLPEHIFISKICTVCRNDLFFSYRKDKTTGRFAAVIGMT